MKPILYEQTETAFTTQGIGVLADALKCIVTEELNGEYDLEMTYPIDGVLFNHLTLRRIIKAKPNQTDNPQPFRIYKISKPMKGSVTVHAHHMAYDLSGMVVPPFSVNQATAVIGNITALAIPQINPFSFQNNINVQKAFQIEKPVSARNILSTFLEEFDCEIGYDKTLIKLMPSRGSDKNARIVYGKNLMDLNQEENCQEVCTGVFPFYHSESGDVRLPEKVIYLSGTYPFTRVLPLDLTASFQEVPAQEQLRAAANDYISKNELGVPKVNLSIKYVSIADSDEAIPLHMFEQIELGDSVLVRFDKLGISKKSRCIKYVYDAITERIESIEIGDKTTTFQDTLAKQYTAIQNGKYEAQIMDAIGKATAFITNGLGGYVIVHRSNSNLTQPDELLILGDSPDLNEAQQVWRWNKNGLGYSSTGYNGAYKTAMTADGKIVADMITTGILRAIEIYNGDGSFHVTPDGTMTATKGTIGGFTIAGNAIYNGIMQLHNTGGLRFMNNSTSIGRISRINDADIGMILERDGQNISWNKENSDGSYSTIFAYNRSTDYLTIYTDVYVRNGKIYNVNTLAASSSEQTTPKNFTHCVVTITAGNPGSIKIDKYNSQFNSYGQYVSTTLVSSNTYQTNRIWQV